MSDPNWIPVAVLPNLYTRRTVEGEIVALAPAPDARIQAFLSAHPKFGEFLSRFTDTFHVPLEPVVFIVREDAIPKFTDTQGGLLSFRDLVALSVVPYARSHGLVYGRSDRIMYANSFWLQAPTLAGPRAVSLPQHGVPGRPIARWHGDNALRPWPDRRVVGLGL
jgi:hypothetical protein